MEYYTEDTQISTAILEWIARKDGPPKASACTIMILHAQREAHTLGHASKVEEAAILQMFSVADLEPTWLDQWREIVHSPSNGTTDFPKAPAKEEDDAADDGRVNTGRGGIRISNATMLNAGRCDASYLNAYHLTKVLYEFDLRKETYTDFIAECVREVSDRDRTNPHRSCHQAINYLPPACRYASSSATSFQMSTSSTSSSAS